MHLVTFHHWIKIELILLESAFTLSNKVYFQSFQMIPLTVFPVVLY